MIWSSLVGGERERERIVNRVGLDGCHVGFCHFCIAIVILRIFSLLTLDHVGCHEKEPEHLPLHQKDSAFRFRI